MNKAMQPALRPVEIIQAGLARRRAAERRFRLYGLLAIVIALIFLALLFVSIVSKGYSAFWQTELRLDVTLDPALLDVADATDPSQVRGANYGAVLKEGLKELFPEVQDRAALRQLYEFVSGAAEDVLRERLLQDPSLLGQRVTVWAPAGSSVDMVMKGHIDRNLPESERAFSDQQLVWMDRLVEQGRLEEKFNWHFLTRGDSRSPEQAGIWGAVVGSFLTLSVTMLLSFPLGVAAAVYLEEFAPKNRLTGIIEVNINNLAAVPSIVFGLLGLAVFINFFNLPRSAPLVGGLVLTLMTLPTIIIASRAALKSVPPSIREAALGVGASPLQTVTNHVLPLAMPGMLTGMIIGMARALGETAPLLMIGMVAFIVDIPKGIFDPATALPVQIYLWADSPEMGFTERTSAAIMVLLAFLLSMNALAVILRRRFERRW
ncbi:MAG TPA: phosphate ABC transporter permease PstA [Candidatus Acidoferrales bacterium]|nr:phosphate ABC transporter permease PstA [Candidatus Acidoferrales bacterium]